MDLRVFLLLFEGRYVLYVKAVRLSTRIHFHKAFINLRTAVAQWLRCCATNRKVTDFIPAGVHGIFIDIKSF